MSYVDRGIPKFRQNNFLPERPLMTWNTSYVHRALLHRFYAPLLQYPRRQTSPVVNIQIEKKNNRIYVLDAIACLFRHDWKY